MNRPGWRLAFSLLVCTSLAPAAALAQMPQWQGSIKSLALYGEKAPAGLSPEYRLSSSRLRLELGWEPATDWAFEAALDQQFLWSDLAEIFRPGESDFNRITGLDRTWEHSDEATSRLQVDRLNLRWRNPRISLSAGRQAIGFGRILIFSPLDVIDPFAPDALDTDVRSGVDALRATLHYRLDGQLGVIAILGKEARYDSQLVTWSDNYNGIDLLMIGGRLRGRSMLGAGLAGSLGTLGLKGEISVHRGRDLDEPGGDLYSSYALAAVEIWYRFDNGLSLILEFLYNGPGSRNPRDYPEVLASAPLQEGLTHLLGRRHLMVAPAYELHPLVNLQGIILWNLDDDSVLLRPTFNLNLADNLELEIFYTWHHGQAPQAVAAGLPPLPRSEFGLRGNSGGFFLKWFF